MPPVKSITVPLSPALNSAAAGYIQASKVAFVAILFEQVPLKYLFIKLYKIIILTYGKIFTDFTEIIPSCKFYLIKLKVFKRSVKLQFIYGEL